MTVPIRGGTDGARLSFMGLPCPNLSTGGYQFHGIYEFIPVRALELMPEVLLEIVYAYGKEPVMYKEQISQWVEAHREELIEDVKKLVRIRSDKGEAKPACPMAKGQRLP